MLTRIHIHKEYIKLISLIMFIVILGLQSCERPVRIAAVVTQEVSEIESHSVLAFGRIIDPGEDEVEDVGFCYNTSPDPEISNNKVSTTASTNTGEYNIVIEGLDAETKYYLRAYIVSGGVVNYGAQLDFDTKSMNLPAVRIKDIEDLTSSTALISCSVTDEGGSAVTARGLYYTWSFFEGTNAMSAFSGNGGGDYYAQLSELHTNAVYFARAYATNEVGTQVSDIIHFIPHSGAITWFIPGNYLGNGYPGSDYQDWDPTASPQIKSNMADPFNLEGYIYLYNSFCQFTIIAEPAWTTSNFGWSVSNLNGDLVSQGETFKIPGGYYFLRVNAENLTYSLDYTNWSVVGTATGNGWDDDFDLSYNVATRTWQGAVPMTNWGEYKFRANHSWDLNYGKASETSDSMVLGGLNYLGPGLAADYAVELDLSHPREYSYNIHRWGIIGDATSGGWSTDLDMVWNSNVGEFSITTDLSVGSFLFRADDNWNYSLKGSDLNALTEDGTNIAISTADNYTITLNPWARTATVTRN